MKKTFGKCLLLLFLFLNPLITRAYGIENYYINAELQNNGDLIVQEYFELNGSYNGFEKIIKYANVDGYEFDKNLDYYGPSLLYNGVDIELNEIRAVDKNSSFDFNSISGTIFEESSSASKGDFGVYKIDSVFNGESYLIYLPDSYDKAFYLKYTLKDMAVLHNDIGELWWQVFGDDLTESIGHLEIKVNFQNNQNEFRVWAHGPLDGIVSKNGQNMLVATVDSLWSYNSIDVRAIFDKEILFNTQKKSGVNALSKILNYEMDAANQANYEREQSEKLLQSEIIDEYNYCLESPVRSCYEKLEDLLDDVTDNDFSNEYNEKLNGLWGLVVSKEEEDARSATETAINFPEYFCMKEQ